VKSALVMRASRLAAISALLALCLMVWGVIDPRPISLVVAMTVGQVLGTLSFAVFCVVVFLDLRKAGVFASAARSGRSSGAPAEPDAARPNRE
jgi:hypothetical protein